jgi:hypothetical protein
MKTTGRQKLLTYVESVTTMYGDGRSVPKANDGILNPVRPRPLWLMARARTIGFRHNDLVLAHQRKVGHATGGD